MPQGEILGHAVGLDRGGKALCGRNNYQGSVARADSQRRTSVHDDSLLSKCPPIGRALLNKTVGDEVEVQTPSGRKNYEIVGLTTLHDAREQSSAAKT